MRIRVGPDRRAALWQPPSAGAELGFGPLESLYSLTVINDRVGMYVATMRGLVEASGLMEKCSVGYTADTRTGWATVRRRGREEARYEFSEADADRVTAKEHHKPIKLSEKTMYRHYPQRMYPARALGFALRDQFPDVVKGLVTGEELLDVDPVGGTKLIDEEVKGARGHLDADERVALGKAFDAGHLSPAQRSVKLKEYTGREDELMGHLARSADVFHST